MVLNLFYYLHFCSLIHCKFKQKALICVTVLFHLYVELPHVYLLYLFNQKFWWCSNKAIYRNLLSLFTRCKVWSLLIRFFTIEASRRQVGVHQLSQKDFRGKVTFFIFVFKLPIKCTYDSSKLFQLTLGVAKSRIVSEVGNYSLVDEQKSNLFSVPKK